MEKHQGYMPVALAKQLIDEMAENLPIAMVPFFRGEPFLHPQWDEILSYAKEKGIGPLQITSNGTQLTDEVAEKILDMELDFISFSVDTVDPALYEKTRKGSNYKKVMGNIQRFLDLKAKRKAQLPVVQVSSVETAAHAPGMDDFIQFWKPKVDRVRIYIEHSAGEHPGSIETELPDFPKRLPCNKVFQDLVILWDGEVAICNHDWTREKDQLIGNVSTQSIGTVWNSPRYQELREMHQAGDVEKEQLCVHCDHWKTFYLPDGFLGQLHSREEG
jgi:radical SAM protein with 4Fe4S-binding SPASM domain